MLNIEKLEKDSNILFFNEYKELLSEFKLYMEIEKGDILYELYSLDKLFSKIENNLKYYQYLILWESVGNNKENEEYTKTFVFGSSSDGKRLYYDLNDMSIWEYWMDDKSKVKLFNSFGDFFTHSKIIDHE
ncbi:SMI1/KNR4 family protein [Acinetobacter gerneri]|uniref:Knr4/Smi1-like domain-containing protein n=1 Tax=Acinetobacter gerneri DSM 14967 = CIP 107464 = MTCC 9824 TaxID=1120926 RepID=N8ZMI0_9GAMM|nr:SMI1/KNR4 family protein [Acinetobacter gerneri]ENV32710.1 hypothetical protein F960_03217 [Acinetobacter gerneri DSM 14967 = CIP 107464 = MTCC 9824]EPR81652.1 hypothetical protein L289_3581 [Acinetobacter gerneri DSM 14967 = CIP 107464 = MTCC 9824]